MIIMMTNDLQGLASWLSLCFVHPTMQTLINVNMQYLYPHTYFRNTTISPWWPFSDCGSPKVPHFFIKVPIFPFQGFRLKNALSQSSHYLFSGTTKVRNSGLGECLWTNGEGSEKAETSNKKSNNNSLSWLIGWRSVFRSIRRDVVLCWGWSILSYDLKYKLFCCKSPWKGKCFDFKSWGCIIG